jgi:phytoene desaturase
MSAEIFAIGFERLADVPFHSWKDMARIMPDMVRLESFRSVYDLVARFVRDERLRRC